MYTPTKPLNISDVLCSVRAKIFSSTARVVVDDTDLHRATHYSATHKVMMQTSECAQPTRRKHTLETTNHHTRNMVSFSSITHTHRTYTIALTATTRARTHLREIYSRDMRARVVFARVCVSPCLCKCDATHIHPRRSLHIYKRNTRVIARRRSVCKCVSRALNIFSHPISPAEIREEYLMHVCLASKTCAREDALTARLLNITHSNRAMHVYKVCALRFRDTRCGVTTHTHTHIYTHSAYAHSHIFQGLKASDDDHFAHTHTHAHISSNMRPKANEAVR